MNTSVSPKVGVIFKSYEPLSAMQAYARQTEASNMSGGFWIAEAYHWFRQYGLIARLFHHAGGGGDGNEKHPGWPGYYVTVLASPDHSGL